MKKKIFGIAIFLGLVLTVGGLSNVKAETTETCDVHTVYYFFLEAETTEYYVGTDGIFIGSATTKEKTFYTSFVNTLPDDFVYVSSGIVPIDRTTTSPSITKWGINQFYTKLLQTMNNSNKLVEDNITYLVHGSWSADGTNYSDENLEISSLSTTILANASILSSVDTVVIDSGVDLKPQSERSNMSFSVTRTVTSAQYTTQAENTIASGEYDWLLEPGLYYIQYKSCNVSENGPTGDLPIYIVWGIGIAALGYAVYYILKYYKKPKKSEI